MDSSSGTANDSFENLCPKCGKPYYYIGDHTKGIQIHLGTRQGWVCPKCGRCFSPDIAECPYCRPNSYSYQTGWEHPWHYYYGGYYFD